MRDNIMTIEDFFALTKLEDGFTDPAQVKDLFTLIIQEEDGKDSVAVKDDASIRQWSTIASAMTITDNEECLDAFAQLDKLSYVAKWLQSAQKIGTDMGDALADDLLRVLDKLQIDKLNLVPSGIQTTVENIAQNSNNSMIQERAKALVFDKWKEEVKSDSVCGQDIEMAASVNEKGLSDGENVAERLGDEQKMVDTETSENSLDHAMTSKDTEQICDTNDKLVVATLEQRSANDVTDTPSPSDSKEDVGTKDEDPCLNKSSLHNSDSLQDTVMVAEVLEQVNDGAENNCGGAEILASPHHNSPDTRKGEEKRNTGDPHNKSQAASDCSTEALSMAEEPAASQNLSVEGGSCMQDFFSPSAVTYQEPSVGFDLNQQVSYEDKQSDLVSKKGGGVDFDLNEVEGISEDEHMFMETQSETGQIVTSSKCTPLDFNRLGNNDMQNLCSSSTSSFPRNFDLNDSPVSQSTYNAPVMKLMGTHVKLDTQNFFSETFSLAQPNILKPRTPDALGSGLGTSCYIGLAPGLEAFYGAETSRIPCAGSSSASTVPYISGGVAFDLNSDPTMMEEGVNVGTTGGLFANGGGNEYFRKRKVADSQWE